MSRAIADATEALEISPRYAEAYVNRSAAYLMQGNHTEALADATKALDLNAQLPDATRSAVRLACNRMTRLGRPLMRQRRWRSIPGLPRLTSPAPLLALRMAIAPGHGQT